MCNLLCVLEGNKKDVKKKGAVEILAAVVVGDDSIGRDGEACHGVGDRTIDYSLESSGTSIFREELWVQIQEHVNGMVKNQVDSYIAGLSEEHIVYGAGHKKDEKKFLKEATNLYDVHKMTDAFMNPGPHMEEFWCWLTSKMMFFLAKGNFVDMKDVRDGTVRNDIVREVVRICSIMKRTIFGKGMTIGLGEEFMETVTSAEEEWENVIGDSVKTNPFQFCSEEEKAVLVEITKDAEVDENCRKAEIEKKWGRG